MIVNDNQPDAQRLVAELSSQEIQILVGLVNGQSIGVIAALLSISLHDAQRAKKALMDKLSAKTTADAVRIGICANVQWPH